MKGGGQIPPRATMRERVFVPFVAFPLVVRILFGEQSRHRVAQVQQKMAIFMVHRTNRDGLCAADNEPCDIAKLVSPASPIPQDDPEHAFLLQTQKSRRQTAQVIITAPERITAAVLKKLRYTDRFCPDKAVSS